MRVYILPFLILSLTVVVVFGQLLQTFYQQDEWYGLGLTMAEGPKFILDGVSKPLDLLFAKGRLLGGLTYFLFASNFPLQNIQMALFAIMLHLITTFLVFILIRRFITNVYFALIGSIFFAVNAVSHQSVTWSMVSISIIPSTILIILALLLFLKYLDNSRPRYLILSGLLIYLSLWFRETGLYLFIFLPLAALLFKKYSLTSFIKQYWGFILLFLLIVSYRVLELSLRTDTANLYITGQNENFFSTLILRAIFYPLTSFSLMFVPGDQSLEFARMVLRQIYPFFASSAQNILIAQTVILDFLSMILDFIIILCSFILLKKEKSTNKKWVYFWLVFTLMSFLPYIIISKDFSYLESRYYYLSMVGGSILFSWVLKRLWEVFGIRIFSTVFLPLSVVYLVFHVSVVKGAIEEQVRLSNVRKDFIVQLKTLVPALDNSRQVFYTTSDQNYWVDGNKLPFQQGSGFTIMVLYSDSGKIPKKWLVDGYLFDIGSQGYRENTDYGFGFFYDLKKLEETIKQYNLPRSSVINLHYDSDKQKLQRQ